MANEVKKRLLLSKWHDIDAVEDLREQLDAKEEALADMTWERDGLEAAVEAAMYWMQDVLVLHKPMSDQRKILTMLERAL